jgi:hypothetical protein
MKKWVLTSLMLCLALLAGTRPSLAASDDTIASMLRGGWKIKQDGVLQRDHGPHQTETFVFGAAGFTWKLHDLQNQLRNLRLAYAADPKPELRKAILNHRQEIANTQKMIALAQAAEDSGQTSPEKVSCNISFGYNASASSLTNTQGVTGSASANFSSNCAFSGEVYAYSYSTATVNGGATTQTLTDGPRSGANVTASAYTSQTGGPSCTSYGYASMTSNNLNPSSYSIAATNTSCPVISPPPSVTVTSDSGTPIYLYGYDCTYITWTANVSGGAAPVTTTMYVNGYSVGNTTSYSTTVCNYQYNTTQTITVSANVTDAASRTASGSQTTTIYHHYYNDGGGGCLVLSPSPDGSKIIQQPCN